MKLKNVLLVGLIGTIIAGCEPNISPNVDTASHANMVQRSVCGTVVSMRNIKVNGDENPLGTLAGAGAGAVAGSAIGGGDRMHILGGIGGALLGGMAGNLAQKKLSSQMGVEYTIKTQKGGLMTVVQSGANDICVGQKVYVVMGPHARVIPA